MRDVLHRKKKCDDEKCFCAQECDDEKRPCATYL